MYSKHRFVGNDAVLFCGWVPTFQTKSAASNLHLEDGSSMFLRNANDKTASTRCLHHNGCAQIQLTVTYCQSLQGNDGRLYSEQAKTPSFQIPSNSTLIYLCTTLSYILLVDSNTVQGTRQISNPFGITFTKTKSPEQTSFQTRSQISFQKRLSASLCVSICPSVRMKARESHETNCRKILYLGLAVNLLVDTDLG